MKSIFFFLILFSIITACADKNINDQLPGSIVNNPASAKGGAPEGNYPILSFDSTEFDFGSLKEGDVVSHTFKFKNTGTSNLVITDVRASCGCTSPSWPKEIIKPGNSNSVVITYNSENREGIFNKGVTVFCNAYPSNVVLKIQGMVYPK